MIQSDMIGSFVLFGFIFGGVPEGIGLVLYLWVNIWATLRTVNFTQGAATPAWLALIWLVPCLGGVLALIGVKKRPLDAPPSNPSLE